MSREDVLSQLRESGETYLSGAAMSRALGVSRAAVWKAVEALRGEGYEIDSAPNRGYRLQYAPDLVREGELTGPLSGCLLGRELVCLDTIDSTNTECKRRALAGAPEGLVVTADEQTGGRGRLGRTFQSPKGKGLYLSVLLRPKLPPQEVADFTAWAAVAVCDAVEEVCAVRPGIKWTNDVVLKGKKLAGILTELGLESETNALQYLVVGIGINVNQTPEDFSPEVREMASSLRSMLGRPVRRAELAAAVLRALDGAYRDFPQDRETCLEKYRAGCVTVGRQVQLVTPVSRQEARALAVDDRFRLIVELPDGTRKALSAGEVSVRGMYGYL